MKTMVIPAYGLQKWKEALGHSLMGGSAVAACGRYLGVYVATRTLTPLSVPAAGQWGDECEQLMSYKTWDKRIVKMEARVAVLVQYPGSAGFRATG